VSSSRNRGKWTCGVISGFEQVTVADIANAAGISQRSFVRYVPRSRPQHC
jgi:hypothetical protein